LETGEAVSEDQASFAHCRGDGRPSPGFGFSMGIHNVDAWRTVGFIGAVFFLLVEVKRNEDSGMAVSEVYAQIFARAVRNQKSGAVLSGGRVPPVLVTGGVFLRFGHIRNRWTIY
jgi:hypothetical protein